MQVTRYVDVDRWYSIEYDWFYLEGLDTSFTFRTSRLSAGDAGDWVNNHSVSPVNGSPFVTSSTWCVSQHGPGWYSSDVHCCYVRLIGTVPNWYVIGDLAAGRMMVRLI
jgi:hypothetical protein